MAKPKPSTHTEIDSTEKFTKHFDGLKRKKGTASPWPGGGEISAEVFNLLSRSAAAASRTAIRPKGVGEQLEPMVNFLIDDLPDRIKEGDTTYKNAAKCFAATLSQAWQSGSLFPSHPEDYAEWFLRFLKGDRSTNGERVNSAKHPNQESPTPEDITLLAEMLLSGGTNGEQDRCGFMPWSAKNDECVRKSEADVQSEQFDGLLINKEKVSEYEQLLAESRFPSEWAALKRRFPAQTKGRRTFHRTRMRERKLQGEDSAKFDTEANRFQSIFDLLCWKYCLWGVEKNKPLLMKPSVNLTPYGTQIFIPAYMSFDPRRDLDLRYIAELHRSRGVLRQGADMFAIRQEARERAVRTAEADEEARRAGLKGRGRLAKMREAGVGRIGESGEWEAGAVPLRKTGGYKTHQDNSLTEDSLIYRRAKKGRQIKAAKNVGSSVK